MNLITTNRKTEMFKVSLCIYVWMKTSIYNLNKRVGKHKLEYLVYILVFSFASLMRCIEQSFYLIKWRFENKNHNQTINLSILNTKVNIWKIYWLPSAFSADYPCSCVGELLPQYEERNKIRKTILLQNLLSARHWW